MVAAQHRTEGAVPVEFFMGDKHGADWIEKPCIMRAPLLFLHLEWTVGWEWQPSTGLSGGSFCGVLHGGYSQYWLGRGFVGWGMAVNHGTLPLYLCEVYTCCCNLYNTLAELYNFQHDYYSSKLKRLFGMQVAVLQQFSNGNATAVTDICLLFQILDRSGVSLQQPCITRALL